MKTLRLTEPRLPGTVGRFVAEPQDGQALAAQLGSEVAKHLSPALERVQEAAASGRIDRDNLLALRNEIEYARRVGMMAQQLVRLCSGQLHLASESIDLAELIQEAVRQRHREAEHRGVAWQLQLAKTEIVSDPTLVFAMLQAFFDWCLEHAQGRVDARLHAEGQPTLLSLEMSFDHHVAVVVGGDDAAAKLPGLHLPALNTMAWRLLDQSVRVLGFELTRIDQPGSTRAVLRFLTGLPGLRMQPAGLDLSLPVRGLAPLTGSHVVVLATRRDLRRTVRMALRQLELVLDFVSSVEELRELVGEALPRAVIYDAAIAVHTFERLRASLRRQHPTLVFIRISDQRPPLQMHRSGEDTLPSVSRDAILGTLSEALLFELSRARHGEERAP